MMNTKYGRLTDGKIEYAPNSLTVDGCVKVNPSATSYLAAGWKKVVDVKPLAEAGCTAELSRWDEDAKTLTAVYKLVQATAGEGKPVRIFSKLKLVAALKEANKWVLVKTWLEEKSYYDYYLAAQNFAEDYPLFVEGREAIKGYLGVTDEEIEKLLAKCIAD